MVHQKHPKKLIKDDKDPTELRQYVRTVLTHVPVDENYEDPIRVRNSAPLQEFQEQLQNQCFGEKEGQ